MSGLCTGWLSSIGFILLSVRIRYRGHYFDTGGSLVAGLMYRTYCIGLDPNLRFRNFFVVFKIKTEKVIKILGYRRAVKKLCPEFEKLVYNFDERVSVKTF